MNDSVIKKVIRETIMKLEGSDEIVIVNPNREVIVSQLFKAVQEVSPNLLTPAELGGLLNACRAHRLGFGLDDNDFQTLIGLTKDELDAVVDKLSIKEW